MSVLAEQVEGVLRPPPTTRSAVLISSALAWSVPVGDICSDSARAGLRGKTHLRSGSESFDLRVVTTKARIPGLRTPPPLPHVIVIRGAAVRGGLGSPPVLCAKTRLSVLHAWR